MALTIKLLLPLVLLLLSHVRGNAMKMLDTWNNLTAMPSDLPESCRFDHYVAIGDSFSAGLNALPNSELPPCAPGDYAEAPPYCCTTEDCGRNVGSYPWQFAQNYAPDKLYFMACSGAKAAECENDQLYPIHEYLNEKDVVTLTIGGNNGDFKTTILECVYTHVSVLCDHALEKSRGKINDLAQPDSELYSLFDKLHIGNPRVFVLGYPWFWVPESSFSCPHGALSHPHEGQKQSMNDLVSQMNDILETAAEAHGFTFVDVNDGFDGHRFCDSEEPWFQGELVKDDNGDGRVYERSEELDIFKNRNKGAFHPTGEGQMVYVRALGKAMGCWKEQ